MPSFSAMQNFILKPFKVGFEFFLLGNGSGYEHFLAVCQCRFYMKLIIVKQLIEVLEVFEAEQECLHAV